MPKPESITSAANPLLKSLRRAIVRGELTSEGYAVAESFHLLEEALRSDCDVKLVLASVSVEAAVAKHIRGLNGIRLATVPDPLFQSIAGTETTQGVIALVRPPEWSLQQLFRGRSLVVVLDGLQDPGNAGTIARAAEAFGATGLLFLKGTVSPFNSKTLRASAGSLFRIPFLSGLDAALARAALQQNGVDLYAGVPGGAGPSLPIDEVDWTRKCGVIIGNEARGVSGEMRAAALDVSIPTVGVESLNAAVAAGILLYEARRQRAVA
ncbi:MAG TPA: RNA methyltransferase [Bryobacteraceae bacterium]|jgi:TrmH family RNA methyltransferase|nr:RNA methyltransferase [Bryobacteraceae bacterium]